MYVYTMVRIQFQGLYVESFGPIKQQYLEIGDGPNVLYGLNGAGKSQFLDCLVKTVDNNQIFSKSPELWHLPQNSTMAGLVFKAESWGAYFQQNSRIWTIDEPGGASGLPNSNDILDALLEYEVIAKLSESPQGRIEVDSNYSKESEDLIRETISSGQLILLPVPNRNLFQIVYCINLENESDIFREHFSRLRTAMTAAHLEYEVASDDYAEPDEIWSKHLKQMERSPLYNVFTLQGSLVDQYLIDYGYGWGTELDKEGLLTWPMPFVPVASLGFVRRAPINLIDEAEEISLEMLSKMQTSIMSHKSWEHCNSIENARNRELNNEDFLNSYVWLEESEKEILVKEFFEKYSDEISLEVNKLVQAFLFGLPRTTFNLGDADFWMQSRPPAWEFSSNNRSVSFQNLSNVQRRFCKLAIRLKLAMREPFFDRDIDREFNSEIPTLLVIDEPESGLNRTGEDYLAKGFVDLTELNINFVAASHSPSFLNLSGAKVNLVEIIDSHSKLTKMKMLEGSDLSQLGLRPGDLLQMYKVFWLVEGEHEMAVFEELFKSELDKHRIKIIALRGVKSLASVADSKLLFDFTTGQILVTVDNALSEDLNLSWSSAIQMINNKQPINKIVSDLQRNLGAKSFEIKNIVELMTASLFSGEWDRLEFSALKKKDLIEYFPPNSFGLNADWKNLRKEFAEQTIIRDFKEFLRTVHGAEISIGRLVTACRSLDSMDPDWTNCLSQAIALSERK